MKVLLILQDPRGNGGTERTAVLAMGGLQAHRHEVHVLHGGRGRLMTGVADGEIGEPALFDFGVSPPVVEITAAAARVRRYVQEHGIDVVHLHSFPRSGLRHDLVAGRPVVVTAHNVPCPTGSRYQWGTGHVCDRTIGLGCLTTGYRSLGCGHLGDGRPVSLPGFTLQMVLDSRFRRAVRSADDVIAPSDWMREHLVADGVERARISVVEPPISVGPVRAVPAPVDAGPPIVSFVGRLVAIKGVDVLLRASARVTVPHRLIIAGDGGARAELEQLAASLGLQDRTTFTGSVAPAEADALRRRSALVAVPSVVPETFGMVGPEALAGGIPVVAHDFAGTSGWLAAAGPLARGVALRDVDAFAAAVTDLLLNPPPAAVRRAVATHFGTRFGVQEHVTALLRVYDRAVGSDRRGRHLSLAGPPA